MKNNPGEEKILNAALHVVAKSTISGTSTRMIAEEAGVAPSNIHYYFTNKEDLMDRLQIKVSKRGIDFRKEKEKYLDPKNFFEAMDLFILQKMDFILLEKDFDFTDFDFWQQARASEKCRERVAESYEAWRQEIKDRVIEPFAGDVTEFDKEQMAYVIVSLLQGASLQYHLQGFNLEGYFSYCKRVIQTMLKVGSGEG